MAFGGATAKRVLNALLGAALTLGLGYFAGTGVAWLSHDAGIGAPAETQDEQAAGDETPTQQGVSAAYTPWNGDESPDYYRVLGPAQAGERPEAGTVRYGELDGLGRATGAVATVTQELMQAGLDRERADLSAVAPSGWGHNAEVDIPMPDGSAYHGFLFNRSHLVAKSLGGDDELHNLITATRTQNVGANDGGTAGGMAYAEDLARSWLARNPEGTVYYAATPLYEGGELVARSVIVDVLSSDGSLDQRIEVYNAALGFEINYADGTFVAVQDVAAARQGDSEPGAEAVESGVEPTGTPEAENGERKVIVTGSGAAYHHDETCEGLANARSMEWVTVSEAEGMGRHPCSICGG